jgi:hypothetical protein
VDLKRCKGGKLVAYAYSAPGVGSWVELWRSSAASAESPKTRCMRRIRLKEKVRFHTILIWSVRDSALSSQLMSDLRNSRATGPARPTRHDREAHRHVVDPPAARHRHPSRFHRQNRLRDRGPPGRPLRRHLARGHRPNYGALLRRVSVSRCSVGRAVWRGLEQGYQPGGRWL